MHSVRVWLLTLQAIMHYCVTLELLRGRQLCWSELWSGYFEKLEAKPTDNRRRRDYWVTYFLKKIWQRYFQAV
jgi:hypothetical protein